MLRKSTATELIIFSYIILVHCEEKVAWGRRSLANIIWAPQPKMASSVAGKADRSAHPAPWWKHHTDLLLSKQRSGICWGNRRPGWKERYLLYRVTGQQSSQALEKRDRQGKWGAIRDDVTGRDLLVKCEFQPQTFRHKGCRHRTLSQVWGQ